MKHSFTSNLVRILALSILATPVLKASLDAILAPLPPEVPLEAPEEGPVQVVELPERKEVVVPSSFEAIRSVDLQRALRDALETSLRTRGDLTLVPLRDLPDLSRYSHPFSLELVNSPSRLTGANILLRFQVENEKGWVGEWSLPFRVHLYDQVWFVRRTVRRGELASASDFERREFDLLIDQDAVPADGGALLDREYSRDLPAGKPLVWSDLAERSLVRKGELVEVVATEGLLAISMRAVARQDGVANQVVVLRNLDSGREFSAKVIGESKVEVIF